MEAAVKRKRCITCHTLFTPHSTLQKVCSADCAILALKDNDKHKTLQKAAERARRQETKERRNALKTKQEWLTEAQRAFNAYIRARDHDQPCISCGSSHAIQWHAGHYRTTKAASQLRFNTYNVNKQCSQCNQHDSGNITEYRINLINKYGLEQVEALEYNNCTADYSIEYLKRVKRIYSKRARQYKQRHASW